MILYYIIKYSIYITIIILLIYYEILNLLEKKHDSIICFNLMNQTVSLQTVLIATWATVAKIKIERENSRF